MQWTALLRKKSGLTLIELMVALVICTLLVGAVYRTFINQGKTYTIQDNVVDMQQSARFAIDRMTREIRVAGFGGVARVLPVQFGAVTLNNIINPDTPVPGALSIVGAGTDAASLTAPAARPDTQIIVSTLTDSQGNPLFDTNARRYLSIDGLECHEIASIASNTNTITLKDSLLYNHAVNTSVYAVRMITYQVVNQGGTPQLARDDNTGQGSQPEADYIETIQFAYYDATGNITTAPNARMIKVSLTARTPQSDPDLKGGDGYRRRNLSTYVQMKDIGLDQQQGGV
jgi:prepilin-type N-terminal cleavage/methylation domain-containing protein